jgi:phage tail protein X
MAVDSYDLVTVEGDWITLDLIIWQRYKMPAFGIFEIALDKNPHLAKLHKVSPFLPIGTQVRIPIDMNILKGQPQPQKTITLYGKVDS